MVDRSDDNDRQQFSPGASFTDDVPSDDQDLSELPSWLQSFASTVEEHESEPDAAVEPAPAPQAAPPPGGDDPSVPGWLSGPREDAQQGGTLSSPGGAGFFSEDDLPEWLRSLNSEQALEESTASAGFGEASLDELSTPPAIQVLAAPAVSNVWMTGMEERVENPAASLFSVIATSGSSRPELAMAAAPRVGQSKLGSGPASAGAAQPAQGGRRRGWSRRERILLIAVIIMLILLLVVLNGNFGS